MPYGNDRGNDERAQKASFVESELSEVLNAATNGYVDHCEYFAFDADESVSVVLSSQGGSYEISVNVTADSNWAILKDVIAAVDRKY